MRAEITLGPEAIEQIARRAAEIIREEIEVTNPLADDDRWLPTREAAAYAGCTVHALHKAMARRDVEFEQPGGPRGKAYFRRADLDRWRQRTG